MSIAGGAGKAVGLVGKPLFNAVRTELKKRGAGELMKANPASIEAELDAALDVLLNDSETATGQLKTWFKRLLSSPPEVLKDQEAWDWIAREDVQQVLKAAARDLIANRSLDHQLEAARKLYAETDPASDWYARPLFEHAVAFLAMSIKAEIGLGAKVNLDAQNMHAEDAKARDADMRERIDLVVDAVTAKETLLPLEEADRIIIAELKRLKRTRAIYRPDKAAGLIGLAERTLDGNLKSASLSPRIDLFRFVAAEQARAGDLEGATKWLGEAEKAGATDLVPDQARLAMLDDRADEAVPLLADRKDSLSKGLLLDALAKAKGTAEAISYYEDHGSYDELPGHTLPRLTQYYFELGRGEDAVKALDGATAAQIAENPLIHFQRARARLALTGRNSGADIFANPHMLPPPGVLQNDAGARRLHAEAIADLDTLELLLRELGEGDFLLTVEALRLYLKLLLRDPAGRTELEEKLKDPEEALVYGPFARLFDVSFDPEPLRARLAQTERLRPLTDAELHTAFQLQVRDRDPKALLAFIDKNRARLDEVEPELRVGVEIEALIRTGDYERASALLDGAGDRLPDEDRVLLRDMIDGKGAPSLERNLKRFNKSKSERDLNLLVQAMVDAADVRAGEHAARLWRMGRRVETAELAANAFAFHGQDADLGAFLDEVGELVDESFALRSHRAWLLFRRGDIPGAKLLVGVLRALKADDANLRQLEINIALETGEWQRVDDLIAKDLERANARTARQLLQAAGLAQASNHPQTMALLRAAVAKAPKDPQVLMNAWDIAVRQGADISEESSGWLATAIAESGDSGPFTKVGIKDIIELRDRGMERARKLDSLIMKGEVTIGLAAKPLGTTLAELILARLWENEEQADPRARLFLPFYAGSRGKMDLASVNIIGLDLCSIMLLHMTGMLDSVFEGFSRVVLAAGTLPSLFEQMRSAGRGQPSRAKRAELIERLIEDRQIAILPDDASLTDEVDRLWAGAEEHDGLMVHAPPLFVPGTFLEEVRNPAPFAARLVSPRSLGAELTAKESGIGRSEDELARLSTFSERWPNEPTEVLNRPLMIDGTALLGLADLDFLEPLLDLGAKIYVTSDVTRLCEQERREFEARNRLLARIEEISAILSKALIQGRASIGPALFQGPKGKKLNEDMANDPLLALLADAGDAEVIVADERVANRHGQSIDRKKVSHPVATSLDVLDALAERKAIPKYARSAARMRLRRSGVGLIGFDPEEFVAAARRSNWEEGPGADLKAIRDSIWLPFLRDAVRLPNDTNWLAGTLHALAYSIRGVFSSLDKVTDAEAAATFALNCVPDLVAYVGPNAAAEAKNVALVQLASFYALVAGAPDLPTNRILPFHRWFEERMFPLLEGRDAAALPLLEAQLKSLMLEDYDFGAEEKALNLTRREVSVFLFMRIPSIIAKRLIEDSTLHAALGDDVLAPILVGDKRVTRGPLLDFIRSAYTGRPTELLDRDGNLVAAKPEVLADGTVRAAAGDGLIRLDHSGLLAEDPEIRRRAVRGLLTSRTVVLNEEKAWVERVEAGPLSNDEFFAITRITGETVEGFHEAMLEELPQAEFEISEFVPRLSIYYRNLFDAPTDLSVGAAIEHYVAADKSRLSRVDAAVAAGPLALSPAFDAADLVKGMKQADKLEVAERLTGAGDPFSLLAALQIVARNMKGRGFKALGDRIVEAALGTSGALDNPVKDFCFGAIVTTACMLGRLGDYHREAGRRRLGAFAHAGHIARVLSQFEVKRDELLARVEKGFGALARLSARLDQRTGVGWEPGLLTPAAVNAYLLRRIAHVLGSIPEDLEPEAWAELFTARYDEYKSEPTKMLLVGLPGPLDEYSDMLPERNAAKSFKKLLNEFLAADPVRAINLAYVHPVLTGLPPRARVLELGEVLLDKLDGIERVDPERLNDAVQIVLLLAWRWKMPVLARQLFERFAKRLDHSTQVLDWAVLAASACTDPKKQSKMLGELALLATSWAPSPLDARSLLTGLKAMANADPDLRVALGQAIAAASLLV